MGNEGPEWRNKRMGRKVLGMGGKRIEGERRREREKEEIERIVKNGI